MAPTTLSNARQTTPDRDIQLREHDTVKKTRFSEAYDARYATESLRSICRSEKLHEATRRKLLRQREILGDFAYRKTRPQSDNLGRKEQVSHDIYQTLVSTSNPVHDQPYEVQISHHNLPIKIRVLQRGLKRHTKRGRRFRQASIEKKISPINLAARVEYGEKY
jgi:hypothetical protein